MNDYTDILLANGHFPPIFGQAASIETAQAATPNNNSYLTQLQKQYNNALFNNTQSPLQTALSQDEATRNNTTQQPSATSTLHPDYSKTELWATYGDTYNMKPRITSNTQNGQNETSTGATGSAAQQGMTAERALNLLQMAQQAAAMRPIAQQAAVQWGEQARNAEFANLFRAIDTAKQGQVNEAGRMATMANNPLINGTARA